MIYERKCIVCGKAFSTMYPAKICCSVQCARERKNMAQRQQDRRRKNLEAKDTIVAETPARENARADKHKEIKKIMKENAYVKKTRGRVCHDCGKPTNDYRCAQCWEKLREKHDLPKHGEIGLQEYTIL